MTDSGEVARIETLLDLRRWDEACRLASARVAENPQDARDLVRLARALLGAERSRESLDAVQSARGAAPNWDLPVRLEASILVDHDPRQALDVARRATRMGPDVAANWAMLSHVAQRCGVLDEAELAAAKSLELAPNWIESMNVTGVVALRRKHYAQAEDWFRRGLAIDPGNAVLLNNLGLALGHMRGRRGEGMELFERSLAEAPSGQLARRNLGAITAKDLWTGGLSLLLLGSFVLLWVGLIGDLPTMTMIGAGGAGGAITWVMARRRRLSEAHLSVLREYERSRRLRFRFPLTRRGRGVLGLVLIVLVLTIVVSIVTHSTSAPRPNLGPAPVTSTR